MAPWTLLLRTVEGAVYAGADRLSGLRRSGDEYGVPDDPLFLPGDEPAVGGRSAA